MKKSIEPSKDEINMVSTSESTKPIIVVKICYKLLYTIQVVKDRVTSWPQLISKFLVAHTYLECCF